MIRGYDEETEQLSDDLVNITGDVINLTKVASNNYKGVSLFTDATQKHYKDVYDYLEGISEIWDELDAKTKQTLMEKLFGKNRAECLPVCAEMHIR
jgi:predicted P-loop ATPase